MVASALARAHVRSSRLTASADKVKLNHLTFRRQSHQATQQAILPSSPLLIVPSSVEPVRLPNKGRALLATRKFQQGELLFEEAPLVAVGDPLASDLVCANCFLPVTAGSTVTRRISCDCGYIYCSDACKAAHNAKGHDVACGQMRELDAFCSTNCINFPRVAAAALARSMSGEVDFIKFWEAVQALVTLPVPVENDALPQMTKDGYDLVKKALSAKMEGDSEGFWHFAFDLRTYARLLGTLRLNSFSIALHDVSAGSVQASDLRPNDGAHSTAGRGNNPASLVLAMRATGTGAAGAAASRDNASSTGGGCGPHHSHDSGAGGCDHSGDPSACSSHGEDGCSSHSSAAFAEPRGGTAVYGVTSLVNHDCDPSAEALLYPYARIEIRARRPIEKGEEVTISYLGSPPDAADATAGNGGGNTKGSDDGTKGQQQQQKWSSVLDRRARLAVGYGFECRCARCTAEAAALLKGRAPS